LTAEAKEHVLSASFSGKAIQEAAFTLFCDPNLLARRTGRLHALNVSELGIRKESAVRKTIEAVYENGSLHPIGTLDLQDKEHVMVTVESKEPVAPVVSDKPWMKWAGCLPDEDADEILRAIEDGCEQVDEDGWE
jgi:predicted DNA-binding antitoxin AbrB/MazE fold protein